MGIQSAVNSLRNFKLGLFEWAGKSIDKGLVSYHTLDEASGVRFDCTDNDIDLNVVNTVGFSVAGRINGAAAFTAVGRLTSDTNTALTDLVGKDFTYSGWFTLSANYFSQTFLALGDGNIAVGNENLSYLFFDAGSQSIVVAAPQGTLYNFFGWNINGGVPLNAWMFMAVKYNSATKTMSLRINDLGFTADRTFPDQLAVATPPKFCLGALTNEGLLQWGKAEETSLFDRMLTDPELDFLYKGGGLQSSVMAAYFFEEPNIGHDENQDKHPVIPQGIYTTEIGLKGDSLFFTGGEGWASSETHADIDALRENSFTLTMWGYINASASANGLFMGISSGVNTGEILISVLYFEPSNGIVASISYNGGIGNSFLFQQIGGGVPRAAWISVQITYDEPTSTLRMRLNDQAWGSTVLGGPTNVNSGLRISFGSTLGIDTFLDGGVDEATIFNGVESDEHLNTLYMRGQPQRPLEPGRPSCAI